jgi:hypothetical protein
MQIMFIIAQVLHVLSGVFWGGTTFALARIGGNTATPLFKPQMGAAGVAIVTGGLLWFLLHRGSFGTQEHVLGTGAICAVLAAGVQAVAYVYVPHNLGDSNEPEVAKSRHRIATGKRIAALLLVVSIGCMAAARYV